MKNKVITYATIRVLLGAALVAHALLSILSYKNFLYNVEGYFMHTSFFNVKFLRYTAPLVPFEEFALGLFTGLGLFSKQTYKLGIALLLFLSSFLFSVGEMDSMFMHLAALIVMVMLWSKSKYNWYSLDHYNNTYVRQQ